MSSQMLYQTVDQANEKTNETGKTWESHAQSIISTLSLQAYIDAGNQYPVRTRKRRKSYTLPPLAHRLVECLNMHNRIEAEQRAKAYMLDYTCGTPSDSPLFW